MGTRNSITLPTAGSSRSRMSLRSSSTRSKLATNGTELTKAYSPTHCYKHRSTFHSTNNTFITPTRHKPNTHSLFQNESDENQTVYSLFPPLNIIHETN